MKVLIRIPPEHYDPFVAKCDLTTPEYSILKNAVIAHHGKPGADQRAIEIVCDKEQALNLLDTARRLYPDVLPAIAAGIDLTRQS